MTLLSDIYMVKQSKKSYNIMNTTVDSLVRQMTALVRVPRNHGYIHNVAYRWET